MPPEIRILQYRAEDAEAGNVRLLSWVSAGSEDSIPSAEQFEESLVPRGMRNRVVHLRAEHVTQEIWAVEVQLDLRGAAFRVQNHGAPAA